MVCFVEFFVVDDKKFEFEVEFDVNREFNGRKRFQIIVDKCRQMLIERDVIVNRVIDRMISNNIMVKNLIQLLSFGLTFLTEV